MANAPSATRPHTNQSRATNGVARTNGAPRANGAARTNGVAAGKAGASRPAARANSISSQGDTPVNGVGSAYAIMANRIANRVAEMAESITFVERPKPQQNGQVLEEPVEKKRPRKLEMRLDTGNDVSFSAPFLDNTLQKMLALQNRMLKSTADLSKQEGVDEKIIRESAAQSAELSRIIALICAEKARQGA
ncbi:hypothetical protein QM012_003595 [Aureobasidium pullulans]|uniref:Uncharacterized protein n=1 Tax=Aureobasidium pullulans TaxID=5580 RepID=A0ABR0T8V2_AURPU